MQIEGRVFVVTGGGNGVGREVVLGLLARGARVAAVDLRADGLAETVEAARGGDRLSTHVVDVTDRAAVEALAVAVVDEYDRVDGLINVAGVIPPFVPFSELDLATMEKVMAVNFWGVVHTVKAFLPHLVTRPQACVVNVSSMGAFAPVPGQAVYGASKAAVMLLTEGLWAEQRGTSVAVTCVFPGGVASDIGGHSGTADAGRRLRGRGHPDVDDVTGRGGPPDHRRRGRGGALPRRHRQGRADARPADPTRTPARHGARRQEDGVPARPLTPDGPLPPVGRPSPPGSPSA